MRDYVERDACPIKLIPLQHEVNLVCLATAHYTLNIVGNTRSSVRAYLKGLQEEGTGNGLYPSRHARVAGDG